jgi:potassium efflux system protein
MLLAAGTFVLGKNLPALLEITVLDRLPIDHGGRHALTIILRYLVYLAGLLLVCRTVSVSWSSVQWLAAAMTVGLGFGLQEIFANLVSGLIILFERPLRVGDLVTVNGVTGTVTRMQIRATTITDGDRREMIVPNKKFITEDVINWTLSDSISRVTIEVGIGYGSDTRLAHSILMRAAKQHPLVLTDPEPMALFKRFGDSTLDFSLHVFIPSRSVYGTVVHDLHTTIDKEFRDAAIEIAFPQRDVNIRSISPNAFPTLAEVAKLPKAA